MKPTTTGCITFTVALTLCASGQVRTEPAPSSTASVTSPQSSLALKERKLNSRDAYAGDDACRSCHQDTVDRFHRTAHYLTSRLPRQDSILGNFTPGTNILKTANARLFFRMDAGKDGFFQTAVEGTPPETISRTERFGFVIGSGVKGQTYLFWKNDQLFQLPVSYWNELGWVNSPGYRDGFADFDRPIVPRCLECHATYFDSIPPPRNRYKRTGFVVGVTCEKCHGPGRKHIQRYGSKSVAPSDLAIANPARLSRDRQVDLCAWCHAGAGASVVRAFSYLPGQPLDKYVELRPPYPDAQVDVHGSQVELLEKSRCFQSSAMTCTTCHDVHTPQHDVALFSERCLSCHKIEDCGMFLKLGRPIADNCVDCHMPNQQTNLIVFDVNGKKASPRMRNHWIKIYPEAGVLR
jgi:hypothetical protein